jgi:dihydropteroate synthase
MTAVVAAERAGVVLMHMRGTPSTMQQNTRYDDLVAELERFLAERIQACSDAGIPRERIVVDPGLGFGKSAAGNLALIDRLSRFAGLGQPVLVGASRKSFVWRTLGTNPEAALEGSLAAAVVSVIRGADILRVHDVAPTVLAVRMAAAIMRAGGQSTPAAESAR